VIASSQTRARGRARVAVELNGLIDGEICRAERGASYERHSRDITMELHSDHN